MKKTALFIVILGVILLIQPMSAQTWLATKRLTWNFGDSEASATSTDSNIWTHVVWCDHTPGNYEIFYRMSTDGGAVWTPAKKLTWNSGFSQFPEIAVDSNDNIQVAWHDNTPGNNEIFFKKGAQ